MCDRHMVQERYDGKRAGMEEIMEAEKEKKGRRGEGEGLREGRGNHAGKG